MTGLPGKTRRHSLLTFPASFFSPVTQAARYSVQERRRSVPWSAGPQCHPCPPRPCKKARRGTAATWEPLCSYPGRKQSHRLPKRRRRLLVRPRVRCRPILRFASPRWAQRPEPGSQNPACSRWSADRQAVAPFAEYPPSRSDPSQPTPGRIRCPSPVLPTERLAPLGS